MDNFEKDRQDFIYNLKENPDYLENKCGLVLPNYFICILEEGNYPIDECIFCTEKELIRENLQLETENTSPKLVAIGMTGDYDILAMKQDKNSKEIYLYADGDFSLSPEQTFENYETMFEYVFQELEDVPENFYSLVITGIISDKREMLQLKGIVRYTDSLQTLMTGLKNPPFTIKTGTNEAFRDILKQKLGFINGKFEFVLE